MSNHNICFHGEIIKISILFGCKKHLIWSYDISSVLNNTSLFVVKWIPTSLPLCYFCHIRSFFFFQQNGSDI